MNPKISVAIITKNEAPNISRAIKSCIQFDEVVIIDSESSDQTTTIAESMGARCIIQAWLGFGDQKQRAVELCSNDWILSLDADEELTPALVERIKSLDLSDDAEAFSIKRVSFFLGKPVRFSGWQNDYVIRLFNRTHAHFSPRLVHEQIMGYKKATPLSGPAIKHYSYQSVADVEKKVDLYSELGAKELLKTRKTKFRSWAIFVKPIFAFIRTFFLRLGILDGLTGFKISLMNTRVTFLKCQKFNQLLKEAQNL